MRCLVLSILSKISAFGITRRITAPDSVLYKAIAAQSSAAFDIRPFKLHRLDTGPPSKSECTTAEALKFFDTMLRMRRIETVAGDMYKSKLIRGFCHMYSGQEAVGAGVFSELRKQDSLITAYRCHSFPYLMGWGVFPVLSELAGRKSGCSRGKGGSMHMYGKRFYGGNGIVGAQVPLGTGLALASMYRKDGGCSLTLYGDGAANQGQVFEAFNIAMLKKLPVVYVCENNRYAMGTSNARAAACPHYYTRGDYIPGLWVDGMDVLAAREATRFAIKHCTSGKGPIVVEMDTYRYYGHSMSDPGISYRPREEVQEVRNTRDPINTFKDKVLKAGLITEEQAKAVQDKVKKDFEVIAQKVKDDPFPGAEEVAADVYSNCLEEHKAIRGVHPNNMLKHINTGHKIPD